MKIGQYLSELSKKIKVFRFYAPQCIKRLSSADCVCIDVNLVQGHLPETPTGGCPWTPLWPSPPVALKTLATPLSESWLCIHNHNLYPYNYSHGRQVVNGDWHTLGKPSWQLVHSQPITMPNVVIAVSPFTRHCNPTYPFPFKKYSRLH